MRCPKCGNEIKEGYLYCELCGEDIHIVPDFEPEFEYSIRESLSGIVEEVTQEEEEKQLEEETADKERHKQKKYFSIMLSIICCLIIGLIVGATYFYRNNSLEYQLTKAKSCLANGNQEKAIAYYEHALALDMKNLQVRFALSKLYLEQEQEELFKTQLLEIIGAPYASEEDITKAYKKLIAFYKEKQDYATINELLLACSHTDVVNTFQEYMARIPEFSYQAGSYAEVIPLKLSANTAGSIYYTEDGSVPDENSEIYAAPIFLETGDYTITAIFVNEYGIKSDIVCKEYHIDIIKPSAPEVQTYSGDYQFPTKITVEISKGSEVYYTTDGSIPTDQSIRYAGPIPMPLGKSQFKFVTYSEEGVSGDVTEREYELILGTELTPENAAISIADTMIEKGKIYDREGNTSEAAGRYRYVFQYAVAIKDTGEFYVIAEVYEDTVGTQTKTGTNYAVNIYDGKKYKLLPDGRDNCILEEI